MSRSLRWPLVLGLVLPGGALAACGTGADDSAVADAATGGDASDGVTGASGGAAASGGSALGGADGTGGQGPLNAPTTLWATASGLVEVWVNGEQLGASVASGAMLEAAALYVPGQENIIAVRASGGGVAKPFVLAELDGVFGKAGTSDRWKVKSAAGSEETTGSDWAAVAYDDGAWSAAQDVGVEPTDAAMVDGPARGVWSANPADTTALLRMRFYVPENWSASAPLGLGVGVTGGADGETVTVTTPSELASAIAAAGPKTILVKGTLDFRGLDGTTSSKVCFQSQCSNGQYEYISNGLGACDSAGKSTFDYSYDKAGVSPLLPTSDKTIRGVGPNATIKGKGFRLNSGVTNVIIQNLTITDINPELIWGGDAVDLAGASRVWIDHNRISLIGRQFLVSHYDANTNITVSFNDFDGNTPYSATCNGAHYWDMLLLGAGDEMTLANNWLRKMSGRTPHAGGGATSSVKVHMVNDFHDDIPGHACDPGAGGNVFYEGCVFSDVTTPVTANTDGAVYAPLAATISSTSAACASALGRVCIANTANSGTSTFRLDASALSAFTSLQAHMAQPYPASEGFLSLESGSVQ